VEKINLLIYTNHFYPENFKVNDIAFDFAKIGYNVTVITGIPNYPKGIIYPGYGFLKKRKEFVNGVKVIRLPLVPRGNGSNFRIILNYSTYFVSCILYTFRLALSKKFDVVFIHETSPIFICLPAILYKKLRKAPVVNWILDLWPESVFSASTIKNKNVEFLLNKLVKKIYKESDLILTSSKGFENSILQKGNFKHKIQYFPNWAEDIFLSKVSIDDEKKDAPISFPKGFNIMYTGNLGEAQNFELILDAAIKLKNQKHISFILVGAGRKESYIKQKIAECNLQNVVLMGNFPITYMPYFFEKASVMLVSLKNEHIFNITVPAKLQAYMGYGKPILALLNGEGKQIVEEANCGFVCSQSNSDELVSSILKLSEFSEQELQLYATNAKNYYLQNFSKEKLFLALHSSIQKILNKGLN
jgi:glycosyltransferase involved in cell wall biosynthesis